VSPNSWTCGKTTHQGFALKISTKPLPPAEANLPQPATRKTTKVFFACELATPIPEDVAQKIRGADCESQCAIEPVLQEGWTEGPRRRGVPP
jgi:hypothetical protein